MNIVQQRLVNGGLGNIDEEGGGSMKSRDVFPPGTGRNNLVPILSKIPDIQNNKINVAVNRQVLEPIIQEQYFWVEFVRGPFP